MTKTLTGAMWALLLRVVLTAIVGRLLQQALIGYYAGIIRTLSQFLE